VAAIASGMARASLARRPSRLLVRWDMHVSWGSVTNGYRPRRPSIASMRSTDDGEREGVTHRAAWASGARGC
jgi:hypothetical protein